ncbi:class I SAM-dependent methyltransferase [Chryseobacterium chendengshani]|uniref:class I SAM-dependent methyltransferase n=1 Tax=Chryseobacterium sp. LJ668 TaxID=2864040 RepID=UPI001C693322|nr:class I SAM-dependent methyltransferase [Chryseobacterium sp. LJ668]MBW8522100.1 class I SAM-dependent methyltransferase [Chryseobacterium sp. LJ668]QYK17748.1 class I SAM-dependent methyltransferase [Chryseobacterium sp. LJ668]
MKIKDHFLSQEIFEIKETETEGVFKTSPIPSNISKYYESEDYISHHQDSGSLKEKLYKFLQSFNLQYKKTILIDRIKKNSKVLDYGCGAGEFVKYIENDFQTLGFEPDADARKAAQNKLSKAKILDDIQLIKDESLDAITLWHVFEHVENQSEMLSTFHSKLKEKGLLIIAVPNPTSYDAKHYREFWAAYDVPRHIFHFSKKGMENLIAKNHNWKMRKIKPLILDSYYISMLSEKYKKSPLLWLKAIIYGTISNVKALFSDEYSSLIYIIEKK